MTAMVVCMVLSQSLLAGTPLGGLTVAVSADGSQVVAGGDTRTLLVLDPETLEVRQRQWIGTTITDLMFGPQGSVLAVVDSSDKVILYRTTDWSQIAELPKVSHFSASAKADLFVGLTGKYSDRKVTVFRFADGTPQASISLPNKTDIAMLALNADGSKVTALTRGDEDPDEKEVPRAEIPKDLKGFALNAFKQRHDGRMSTLLVMDVASETIASQRKVFFYGDRKAKMAYHGEDVFVITYSNVNAKIAADGTISLFELGNSYNYGRGFTRDNSMILTGGLAKFSLTPCDSLESKTGKVDSLPGWPEYWKGFSGTADGTALYGASSAYRVVKFNPDGTVAAIMQGH